MSDRTCFTLLFMPLCCCLLFPVAFVLTEGHVRVSHAGVCFVEVTVLPIVSRSRGAVEPQYVQFLLIFSV